MNTPYRWRGPVLRLATGLLSAFFLCSSPAHAQSCAALPEVPDSFQVAWVSKLGARAGTHTALEVVRVAELRKLVEANDRDPTAVLRALGLVGKRAQARGTWKVTVFDVKRDWLCRPVDGPEEATLSGVAACPAELQHKGPGTLARSWSGCGYLLDTASGARTLDTWRIEWGDAVALGFCVLPLRRFLEGA